MVSNQKLTRIFCKPIVLALGGGDLNMHTWNHTNLKGFLVCRTPEGKTKRSICSRHWSSWKEQTSRMSPATFPDTISSSNYLKGLLSFWWRNYSLHWTHVENQLSLLWYVSVLGQARSHRLAQNELNGPRTKLQSLGWSKPHFEHMKKRPFKQRHGFETSLARLCWRLKTYYISIQGPVIPGSRTTFFWNYDAKSWNQCNNEITQTSPG